MHTHALRHLGEEAHCVIVRNGSDIVAVGNGTRGAIFALYELADKILGVDPWWRFTQNTPEYQGTIEVDEHFASVVPPPAFKYRGVFTNDEDLLGYFRRDPAGKSVFDLRTWDTIFETLLRAKANMIIPGTTPNPDEPQIELANNRGLAISQSHFEVMDFGALQWLNGDVAPRSLYNWTTNPDIMAHTWKAAIAANADKDFIWTVGLRGLWDYACVRKRQRVLFRGFTVYDAGKRVCIHVRIHQPTSFDLIHSRIPAVGAGYARLCTGDLIPPRYILLAILDLDLFLLSTRHNGVVFTTLEARSRSILVFGTPQWCSIHNTRGVSFAPIFVSKVLPGRHV